METKAIKISVQCYNKLDLYRLKGETFSDALRKVLNCAELVRAGASTLGPVGWYDIREPLPTDQSLSERLDRQSTALDTVPTGAGE